MKPIFYLSAAFSIMLSLFTGGSFAGEQCSSKDLYFEQLENPKETLNTGLKYWIVLRKGNSFKTVDNTYCFKSGEQIRFQIIPNTSSYAYIVLQKGTSGAQKLLFPNSNEVSGKMLAGKLYQVPVKGYLRFDKTPGTETIRIVLARKMLDKTTILNDEPENKITIAASSQNTDPLISSNCIAAFSAAEGKSIKFSSSGEEFSKDLEYVPGQSRKAGSGYKRPTIKRSSQIKTASKEKAPTPRMNAISRANSVTVINTAPEQKLIAEIQLKHI